MITLTDLLKRTNDSLCNTIKNVKAFEEYVQSRVDDITEWLGRDDNDEQLMLVTCQTQDLNNPQVTLGVSKEQYDQAQSYPDETFQAPYKLENGQEVMISLTGEQICDGVETLITDLRCQKEFISYAFNAGEVKVSEMVSLFNAKIPGITGVMLDTYTRLIESTSAPIDAISNFFMQFKTVQVNTSANEYVSVPRASDYRGDVFSTALAQIGDDMTNLVNVAIDAFSHLDEFGQRLLNGLIKYGKNIFGSLFGQFLTDFEKASNAVNGVMDFPIFSFHWSSVERFEQWARTEWGAAYAWDGTNHYIPSNVAIDPTNRLDRVFLNLFYQDMDGQRSYKGVTQVVVPVPYSPFAITLQTGWDSNNEEHLVLQGFLTCNYSEFSKYSDNAIKEELFNTVENFLEYISSVCPACVGQQTVDDTSIHWNDETDAFYKWYSSYADKQLYELVQYRDETMTQNSPTFDSLWCRSFLLFMCLFSKGFKYTPPGSSIVVDVTNTFLGRLCSGDFLYAPGEYQDIIVNYENNGYESEKFNTNTFRPYNKRYLLGSTVHYQTVSERAQEYVGAMYKILIIAVAIYAAAKVFTFIKNRQFLQYSAQAAADAQSWTYAEKPTANNLDLLKARYNRARRITKVNRLLGLSSALAVQTANASYAANQSDANISALIHLISGV